MPVEKTNTVIPQIKHVHPFGGRSSGVAGTPVSGGFEQKSNLFAGSTEGINNAVTGTAVYASAQAGKNPGILGRNFQAIG